MNGAAKGGDDVSRGRSHTHKLSCQHSCKFTRRCQLLLRHAFAHSSLRKLGSMVVRFSALITPATTLPKKNSQPKRSLLLSSILPSPSRPILAASAKAVASFCTLLQLLQRLILFRAPSFAHMRKKLALQRGCSCGVTPAPCAHPPLAPIFEETRHYQEGLWNGKNLQQENNLN